MIGTDTGFTPYCFCKASTMMACTSWAAFVVIPSQLEFFHAEVAIHLQENQLISHGGYYRQVGLTSYPRVVQVHQHNAIALARSHTNNHV